MDLATALVEAAVGAATLAVGVPLLRSGGTARRALGALLTIAGLAAVLHAGLSVLA